MRIIVNGQQAFGQSVLKALIERGEDIVGVYCVPDQANRRPDPLRHYAAEQGLPIFQPRSYRRPEVWEQMAALEADLCVMAFVTHFVPEEALDIPRHGSIQYHPSLLPRHRGPSAINWPIIWGESKTGLSIFRPTEGLDEGPVLIQKEVVIDDEHTLGTLYFNHLYPMGVAAMLEGVDLVRRGEAPGWEQDHAQATYEGRCRHELVQVNWHMPLQTTWNLVRGANPQPGAWTTFEGASVQLFNARKVAEAKSVQPGEITAIDAEGVCVAAADGQLKLLQVRPEGAGKLAATEWAVAAKLKPGARFAI